jgi:hypothetical protein
VALPLPVAGIVAAVTRIDDDRGRRPSWRAIEKPPAGAPAPTVRLGWLRREAAAALDAAVDGRAAGVRACASAAAADGAAVGPGGHTESTSD